MSLNRDKCKILNFYRSKNPITHQYTINGVPLDTVTRYLYLRVELSSNLNWSLHIEYIIGKANRSLGFIRRNLYSCPESVKSQAYLTLVRPPEACGTHILKALSWYWMSPAACHQICEKLLRAGTRHSHKPPERFELAFFRTETQNDATYCHV